MKGQFDNLKFIEGRELKAFLNKLNEQFGIEEIPGRVLMRGKEKVFLFTGQIDAESLNLLESQIFVERAGAYIAKNVDGEYRLSIEGSQIFKNQITKNVVEVNDEEMDTWMCGHEILKETDFNGFVIIKYKDEMLGTGKASSKKITNFIPKSRRLKDKSIRE